VLVSRVLVHQQVGRRRFFRVQAQQSADALGGLALVAEGAPDDANAQIRMLMHSESWATQAKRMISPVLNLAKLDWLSSFLER
jgi:hypothetical protein